MLENLKVISDRIWWTEDNQKIDVKEINVKGDTCGEYFFKPQNVKTFNYKCTFEEVSIKKIAEGLYDVKFWAISSPYVRSEDPFLHLQMTREQIIEWYDKDVWFKKEYHYIVRRVGKKFYKKETDRRCIKCHTLLGDNDVKAFNHSEECENKHYKVDENMNTVELVRK